MSHSESKMSKSAIHFVSLFFAVGLMCTAIVVGMYAPVVIKWLCANSKLVIQALMVFSIVPILYVLGQPVAYFLQSRER